MYHSSHDQKATSYTCYFCYFHYNSMSSAIIYLTLLIAANASFNAANVNALDQQNIGKYSSGPCEWMHSLYIYNIEGIHTESVNYN